MNITLRALTASEWIDVRDLRLHALKTEPGVFRSSFDKEAFEPPERWQETIQGDDHQLFGLFDEAQLIGITAVFTSRDDPTGQTALLAYTFIQPQYRGLGLSRLFYKARLDWIKSRPQYTRVVVSHRASNERSRHAILRHGFVESGDVERTWPDGATEPEITYELNPKDLV